MESTALADPLPRMDRAQSPRSDKRERILDAASAVFARDGYHRARVSDIAREANIAYGLVYHYFTNKEEILRTIFEERWSGLLDAVDGVARSDASVEEKLESVAALILDGYRVRPDWVKVVVLDILRTARFADPGQLRAVGRLFQLVARIVRDGQAAGVLRPDLDPGLACSAFLGALELVITSRVLDLVETRSAAGGPSEPDRSTARTVVDILLHGLQTGARPR
ncbi:MAG: TetR/AcrR family transcriptional regulator [Deltaproteobacteria bacterium]|nr:MAG: TetR/AcrR family transcriptional regulator [Deltaproteobacteria bacterium]